MSCIVSSGLHACERMPTFVQKIIKIYKADFILNIYFSVAYVNLRSKPNFT